MSDSENIINRLLLYIKYKGITTAKFERSVKTGNNYLKNVKSIGSDKLSKILEIYPDLNIVWLITGEGEMLKDDHLKFNSDDNNKSLSINDIIKIITNISEADVKNAQANLKNAEANDRNSKNMERMLDIFDLHYNKNIEYKLA